MRLLSALVETGEVLGAQACLISNGRVIVDACAGVMGPVDPRPVRSDSLFQLFQAGCPLLSTRVLMHAERGAASLDAPVSAAWPAFAQRAATVRQVL